MAIPPSLFRIPYSLFMLLGFMPLPALAASSPAECPIRLTDVTTRAGITFRHTHGGNGQKYLPEFMTGGLALFDYDGDGAMDIYFLNGAPLKGTPVDTPSRNALYRNRGDGTFADVTEQAGVGDPGHSLGVTVGDYDNDGHPDLYVSNFGRNVLYRNHGDGTFADVTERAGVARGDKFGAGTCFLDIEGDGDLDLYVANYVAFTYERHAVLRVTADPYPPGPQDFPPVPDMLFRNNGDGTFTDISGPSGIAAVAGPSMGAVCLDYDDDGDTDIFVCNDAAANFLFRNDGRGHFQEVAVSAGVAFDLSGNANGHMGADCGDYDGDGRLDLFVTDYTRQRPILFRNAGQGLFEDASNVAGIATAAYRHTKWGSGLVDFDNDGRRDVFIACGHFLENIRDIDEGTAYRVPNAVLWNTGRRFVDVSAQCGDGMAAVASGRGAAFDDLDHDGAIDVAVLNSNARPTILRNATVPQQHWVQVLLHGIQANRDSVGARVRVVAGDLVQVAEVHSGRAYQSHYGTRLHFGLGPRDRVDRIEVRWIGGGTETFPGGAADRVVSLTEGSGSVAARKE